MSLTTEQISELHDLALARLGEFDSVAAHLPKLLPAYVRIVVEVYEEWQAKAYEELCRAEEEAETPRIFEWHKQHLDYADTNGTIAVRDPAVGTAMNTDGASQPVILPGGVWPNTNDMGITAADLAAFESVWPAIPDLQGGVDLFAEHPIAEEPEPVAPRPAPEPPATTHPAAKPANTPAAFKADLNRMLETLDPALRHLYPRPVTRVMLENLPQLEADLKATIAHLQDKAVDGVMPTILAYNATRPKGKLLAWSTIPKRYHINSWRELADVCGLRLERKSGGDAPDDDDETNDDDSDAPKHPRRMGYEYKRPDAEPRLEQPTLQQLTTWLHDNAMGGVMMTQDQFNTSKPAHWATATAHVARLGMTWEDLREEAGLKPNPRWGRTWAEREKVAA